LRSAFLEEHRDSYPVRRRCSLLDVSASGFDDWRERPASPARQRREQLQEEIRAIHARVNGRYGSPRVHAE
jgi:putative transposase